MNHAYWKRLIPLEVHRWSVEELIVLPLILDVLSDGVFVDSDCADEVPSAPETLLLDGMTLPGEQIVHTDRTLSFEESHDVGNRKFRGNFEEHVDVVGAGIGFENFCFFLRRKLANNLSDLSSCVAVEHFLAVFGYNDHVILAVPDHMTLRFE